MKDYEVGTTAPSLPAKAVWIETFYFQRALRGILSLPAKAVWIETFCRAAITSSSMVTACEGGVD